MIDFYLQIYNDLNKNGMGVTALFPNEIRIFLIESNNIEKAVQLSKIMNICKNNPRELITANITHEPLEFAKKIESIYVASKKTTLEDMSETLIFHIIFLLIDKNVQTDNLELMKEFQELDEQIRTEYLEVVQIIKKEKRIQLLKLYID